MLTPLRLNAIKSLCFGSPNTTAHVSLKVPGWLAFQMMGKKMLFVVLLQTLSSSCANAKRYNRSQRYAIRLISPTPSPTQVSGGSVCLSTLPTLL